MKNINFISNKFLQCLCIVLLKYAYKNSSFMLDKKLS